MKLALVFYQADKSLLSEENMNPKPRLFRQR
jgi:hypothetical protein